MGQTIQIKQDRFEHGMQGDVRNKNLTSQSQVFGASKVKHFDIYGDTKLKPIPSLERFNTDLEKDFKIGVVGGIDTLYGLGAALDNWYGQEWQYRIEISSNLNTIQDYLFIDLSTLSDNFWNNVNDDGSDIRFTTTSSNETLLHVLSNFDKVSKSGFVIIDTRQITNLYFYFGHSLSTTPQFDIGFRSLSHFYPLESAKDFAGRSDLDEGADFIPVPALIGTGASGQFLRGSTGSSVGSERNLTFLFRKTTDELNVIVGDDFSVYQVSLRPDGKIRLSVDTDNDGIIELDSVTTLSNDVWYHISTNYDNIDNDGVMSIYIDGVLDATSTRTGAGNIDSQGGARLNVSPTANQIVDMVSVSRSPRSATEISANHDMLTSNIWIEGSLEQKSSVELTYSGIQVYTREFNTAWKEVESNGRVVRLYDYDPVYSFIQEDSLDRQSFLMTDSINQSNPTIFGTFAQAGFITEINSVDLGNLSVLSSNPVMIQGVDKRDFISLNSELESYNGSTYTDGVFLSGTGISSIVNNGYNLALTGNRKDNRGSIEIWDLLQDDPTTVIDTGVGMQRVIANVKGSLVAVSDNFISDANKSFGQPSIDFKQWIGRDRFSTIQSFNYDVYNPTFIDSRNGIINNYRSDLNNFSTFHAEPSAEDMGMWAIGSNEINNTVGVSIPFDTSSIGRIVQHHPFGNNIILITEDFEQWTINKDNLYNQTSMFESMVVDAGVPHVQKHINKFEITLDKELPAGQVISAFYRNEQQDSYIKMLEFTQSGEKTWEANQNFDETAFNSFHELQIKIESTGGNASIVEWVLEVEYEDEE